MSRIPEPRDFGTARIHTITALVVSWSFLCCRVYPSHVTPCPSAEEGKSFALECERRGQSHWEVRLQTGASTEQILTCQESETCDWGQLGQVSVTTRQGNNGAVSHINISRVTPSWRNKTLRCVVQHETHISRSTECKMDNYHKPESAHCEALKRADNAIRFTCRTRRIYPKLRCEVTQFASKYVEDVSITDGFEYTNLLRPDGYYDSSCSVDIGNLRPGRYQYFGALIPVVDYKKYVRNMSVAVMPTLPIEITSTKPYVSLLPHDTGHHCIDTQKTFTFLCQAHKFESRPDFQWLLWDPANNTTSSLSLVTQGAATTNLSDVTSYMSSYSTPLGRQHVGKHIVCSASTSNIRAQSAPVNVRLIPPVSALFTELNGQRLGTTHALSTDQRLTIACSVDADDRLFIFHVYCHGNDTVFPPKHDFGHNLVFAITAKGVDTINCTCIVDDVCYKVNTTLQITVVPSRNITTHTNNAVLPDYVGRNMILYFFVGAVVLIVLVCIISSLISSFCRRGSPRGNNRNYSDDHVYERVV